MSVRQGSQPESAPEISHHRYHSHAKLLLQHILGQHTPLTMVVGAMAKGLVSGTAAGGAEQPGGKRCVLSLAAFGVNVCA
jgi:hypothetical protein